MYELLSLNESCVATVEEWDQATTDIREQFALDPEETHEIARELAIRHPRDPGALRSWVMTTDLLVTKNGTEGPQVPISVKDRADSLSKRTQQKFAIESEYWARRGLFLELRMPTREQATLARNVEWILPDDPVTAAQVLADLKANFLRSLARRLASASTPLGETCAAQDRAMRAPIGTALLAFRLMLASRRWSVDLYQLLHPCLPISEFSEATGPAKC